MLRTLPIALVALLTVENLHASRPESSPEPPALRYLGISVAPGSIAQAIESGLRSVDPGVQIVGVDHLSPAELARLREGDIIMYANGRPIFSREDIDTVLRGLGESTQVELSILREGERRKVTLSAAPAQPKGYLGFELVPLCERDSIRATLPADLAGSDSLPIVSWIVNEAGAVFGAEFPEIGSAITGIGNYRVRMFGILTVVSAVGVREVRSISDLAALSDSIGIGDAVLLQFYSRGDYHAVCFRAQAPTKPWSGLRLEAASPALIEAESLVVDEGENPGLFVRKIEAGSSAEWGGFKPRDRILGFDGDAAESIAQFEERYAKLRPGQNASLLIRNAEDEADTLLLRRSARLDYIRATEAVPGMLVWERLGVASHGRFYTLLPFFSWSKVTGPVPFERIEARFGSPAHRVDAEWWVGYGVDNDRWQHRVSVSFSEAWFPKIWYVDGPTTFYRDQLSSASERWVFATFAGIDRFNYVRETGWKFSWKLAFPHLPAHAVYMNLDFTRETALPTVSQPSWISGRQEFSPNPVDGVAQGSFRRVTLLYQYSRIGWRSWARTFLDADARIAGGPLGGDHEYKRWELNGAQSLRLFRRLYLDCRLRAGLATGALPLQEEFYAGGPGTLPGYEDREFSGNRTLLLNAQLSYVLFMAPGKSWQFRVFSGIDAGNAWRSARYTEIPRMRSDVSTGVGYFWLGDELLLNGVSISWATPIDSHERDGRVLVSFWGAFERGGY